MRDVSFCALRRLFLFRNGQFTEAIYLRSSYHLLHKIHTTKGPAAY